MTYSDLFTYIWKLSLPEQNEKEETLTTNVWIEIVSILHNLPGASHKNSDFSFLSVLQWNRYFFHILMYVRVKQIFD